MDNVVGQSNVEGMLSGHVVQKDRSRKKVERCALGVGRPEQRVGNGAWVVATDTDQENDIGLSPLKHARGRVGGFQPASHIE